MTAITLEPAEIVRTLERLVARIEARFPGAGLAEVGRALTALSRDSARKAEQVGSANWGLRLLVLGVVAAGGYGLVTVLGQMELTADTSNLFNTLQGIDSFLNIVLVAGAAVFSLVTIETRLRRAQALKSIHAFRAIVHVIDMHQLTKDPSVDGTNARTTSVSPKRDMTPFELSRYLDYCSEMLSLTAKTAALYAIASSDPAVTTAVNEIEQLTSNLSQKIWQKIMIVKAGEGDGD